MRDMDCELKALGRNKHTPDKALRQRTVEALTKARQSAPPRRLKALRWAVPAATAAAAALLLALLPGVRPQSGLPAETAAAAGTAPLVSSAVVSPVEEGISYISIDVNPSIELTVKYGVVLDAAAYNDDGSAILLSVNVPGMTPDNAVAALIAEFAAQGYISPASADASIVITVYGDDEDGLLAKLQTAASDSLSGLGVTCDIVASAVAPDTAQTARAAGITPGKYLLLCYLAERDGITIEAARDLYGSMKMKALLAMVPDPGEVFGKDAYVFLSTVAPGLTSGQLQILEQAKLAYQAAMKAAVKAYNQAKEDARAYFQAARDDARDAFKETRDHQAWQQAKTAAKHEMEQRYATAKQAFGDAKAQAEADFRATVAGLGMTEEQIKALLEWNFDYDWNFDYNWEDPDDDSTGGQSGHDEDDEDDGGGGGNGHGNGRH